MTRPATTTQAGAPIASDTHSLTVGADGPTVLHDHHLVEKIAAFNRERVPERNPHAKGGGAFGEFVVTEDGRPTPALRAGTPQRGCRPTRLP